MNRDTNYHPNLSSSNALILWASDQNGFEHPLIIEPPNRGFKATVVDGLAQVLPVVVLGEQEISEKW